MDDRGTTLDFPREGYELRAEPDGLLVRATDYHAGELKLPWALLAELARKAQAPAREGGAAAG